MENMKYMETWRLEKMGKGMKIILFSDTMTAYKKP